MNSQAKKWLSIWLGIGLILVFVQVVIGGITRLTDSGLSITEWEIVKGVVPPIGEESWNEAFAKYQIHAKKQFETIHNEMTLSEFKVIYFWEWFHRLWARSMGLIFFFPFVFFLYKKWLPSWLIKRLGIVIALAALAGTFGWIMVASGLNEDNRTWVSAYKLAGHLMIATTLFAFLFYTFLKVYGSDKPKFEAPRLNKLILGLIIFCFGQIMLGAFMAGMRAGAIHTHWPIFAGNNHLLEIVGNPSLIQESEIMNYEGSVWIKGLVQVLHRTSAVLLLLLSGMALYLVRDKAKSLKQAIYVVFGFVGVQYLLGVLAIIGIVGNKTPVFLGVAHQGVALLFLASLCYTYYILRPKEI
jgi:cytochrome c oxidase assembly protein subunit 15